MNKAITVPGIYRATLIIDAGPLAGTVQLPVTYDASGVPATQPFVSEAFNSADANVKTLAPGSRAVLRGLRFQPSPVVMFNDLLAQVLAAGPERIEVVVPEQLGLLTTARVVMNFTGQLSPPFDVALASAAPAIYPGAVYNQDNTANAAATPEQTGRALQVFLTGLSTSSRVIARFQGELQPAPTAEILYSGPAPGYVGVQQVNLRLPPVLPNGGSNLLICDAANQTVCAPPVRVYARGQ